METIETLNHELKTLITDKVNTENFLTHTLTTNFKSLEKTDEIRKQLTEIVNQLGYEIEAKQSEITKNLIALK